jgi:hypothetical protein
MVRGLQHLSLLLPLLFLPRPLAAQVDDQAAQAVVAPAASGAPVGLLVQPLEGERAVERITPGRLAAMRLSVLGAKDSASASARLDTISLTLVHYGDAESAQTADSATFTGASAEHHWERKIGFMIIPLGKMPASDSAFIVAQEGNTRYARRRVWQRSGDGIPSIVLYGNPRMPGISVEKALAIKVDTFIQKIVSKGGHYKLTPQPSGELPVRRPGALGVEVRESSGLVPWLTSLRLSRVTVRGQTVDTLPLGGRGFSAPTCLAMAPGDPASDSLCQAFVFLGRTPEADTVDILVGFRDASRRLRVWKERSSQFLVGLALGSTFPLNKLSANDTISRLQPRLGFNGRVIITDIEPQQAIGRIGVFNTELFRGPIVAEGELLLGLSTLQEGIPDSNRYEQATEGNLRFSMPIVDFGRAVAFRGMYEIGSVSIRNSDDLQGEQYIGFRLGLDPADLSGRQSYIELVWGKSENLTPDRRRRLTVQFRVPTTNIVLQFRNNFARTKKTGLQFENTSVLSAYVPLTASEVLRVLGLRGIKPEDNEGAGNGQTAPTTP